MMAKNQFYHLEWYRLFGLVADFVFFCLFLVIREINLSNFYLSLAAAVKTFFVEILSNRKK